MNRESSAPNGFRGNAPFQNARQALEHTSGVKTGRGNRRFTFLDQPDVPFDNNLAERSIRPAVILRKNHAPA